LANHQAREQVEHRVRIDPLPAADRLGRARAHPPANTASQARSACSDLASSSKDQSIAAHAVR
jgi:hypothetical protein